MPKNTKADYRRAIERYAKRTKEGAAKSGIEMSYSDAKADAQKRAERVRRKHDND